MPSDEIIETMARAFAPLAWAALGTGDTLAHLNRRKASMRHARAALSAAEAAGWVMVPAAPTAAMIIAAETAIDDHKDSDFSSAIDGSRYSYTYFTAGVEKAVWDAMLAAAGEPE